MGVSVEKNTMDLTSGNIPKQIFLFALPIFLGQVSQNLYNSVDSIVVGNYVGTTALAAVTSYSDISMFLVGLFTDNSKAIRYGAMMLETMTPFFYCQALNQTFSNAVRGFGKSTAVMILSIIGMVGCRQLFLAVAMHIQKNIIFVYIGFPLGWFCGALFVMIYYFVKIRGRIEIKSELRKKQSTAVSAKN